jgi:holo-[acyl-carrier protein] synthase
VILGLGIDVCPVERIQGIIERHGAIFTDRVFTAIERDHAGEGVVRAERLAARWAAKEAAIKALGAPPGLRWHDLEVVNDDAGAPALELRGSAAERAAALGTAQVWISLSHAGGVALAVVILEGKGG